MPKNITALEVIWGSVWVRAATYITLAIFVVWLLFYFSGRYSFALQVAIIGFVVAYILNPIVEALGRIRIGRAFAVVLVYLMLLLLLLLGSVLISQVVVQISEFIRRIPVAIRSITPLIQGVSEWLAGFREGLPDFLADRFGLEATGGDVDSVAQEVQAQIIVLLEEAARGISNTLQGLLTDGPSFLLTGATSLISTTAQVFLILLVSAYFLYDFPRFVENFRRYVPLRWRPLYNDILIKADRAVGGYLRGQLLITALLGVFIWMGLRLIGVPLAEAISFLAAIFNLVPYLGPIIGVIPAVVLGFTVSPLTALLAVVVFVVANNIEGYLLSPLIHSRSTNLHPVTVLLAILAGVGLFGLLGALLAVPVVALLKVILEEYLLRRPAYTGVDEHLGHPEGESEPVVSAPPVENPVENPVVAPRVERAETEDKVAGDVPEDGSRRPSPGD